MVPAWVFLLGQFVFGQADDEFFEAKIRPIFAEHCSECHSSESDHISGNFNIDSRNSILTGGDTGPAIVPGEPSQSLLVDAINYRGYYEMPPDSKLPQDEINLIEEWVKRGAPWPNVDEEDAIVASSTFDLEARRESHWAWQLVKPTAPPECSDTNFTDWPNDPIDKFVLAKLQEHDLAPAAEADKATWIRRVYFDLIGLPPSRTQIEAFINDSNENAYENVVDQLLASNHFGERWARHWMDLVRYAETYGHEFDYPIEHAYQYRDYLIRAFNNDIPYDQLIREHVAGDLLPKPRLNSDSKLNESIIGTGFWHLGEATHAPVEVKADEAGRIDNQIDVLCKTFQGMTVACARCHDHKFDAISAADYYALSGFLQSSRRQIALLDPDKEISANHDRALELEDNASLDVSRILAELKQIGSDDWRLRISELAEKDAKEDATGFVSIAKLKQLQEKHHPLHTLTFLPRDVAFPDFQIIELKKSWKQQAEQYQKFLNETVLFEDFSDGIPDNWFATGWGFGQPKPHLHFSVCGNIVSNPGVVSSCRLGKTFQSVLRSPTFELTHDKILVRVKGASTQIRLIIDGYEMDIHNPLLFNDCKMDVTVKDEFVWLTLGTDVKNYKGHRAYLEFIDHGDGHIQVDEIRFANEGDQAAVQQPSVLTKLVLDQNPGDREEIATAISIALESFLKSSDEKSYGEFAEVTSLLIEHSQIGNELPKLIALRSKIQDIDKKTPSPLKVVAMADGTPEDERLFIRGNVHTLGDLIPRRFLTALLSAPQPDEVKQHGSGRLELAEKIASKSNPLTSRVVVNRLWHHLLGKGIVSSVDNFGVLGQKPTHPELLDYLATEFTNDGWSIKQMIRRIVLTKTYRMASDVNPSAEKIDPENKLLYRANIKRLEGEAIRDSILKVSGNLNTEMYGPSVPIHLTDFMQGRGRPRADGPLDGNGRRSVYVIIRRNFLSPMMLAFDSPIPFNSTGARHQSNVPAQALIMMNDPFIVEQAKKWAQAIVKSELETRERIEEIFVAAFGRVPNEEEIDRSLEFFRTQTKEPDVENDSIQDNERVWQDYCHVIFNMKEFIFVK